MKDPEYRVYLKTLLKKYSLHKVARKEMQNDLSDEINEYYKKNNDEVLKVVAELTEGHEKELKN